MIRNIVIATSNKLEINLPTEYVGKKIEYLIFSLLEGNTDTIKNATSFAERTKNLRFNSKGYKFNRDDANDYPTNNDSN